MWLSVQRACDVYGWNSNLYKQHNDALMSADGKTVTRAALCRKHITACRFICEVKFSAVTVGWCKNDRIFLIPLRESLVIEFVVASLLSVISSF